MKTKAVLIFLIFVLGIGEGFSQEGQPVQKMSLKEVISYALENNPNLVNARIDKLIAKKTIWETTAIGLPQVNMKGTYSNIFKVPEANFGSYYLNNTIPDNAVITPQVIRDNLSLAADPMIVKLGVKENITADFTVSQLIFSGEYIVGLQAARTFFELSTRSVAKTELEVKEAVTNAYYGVLVLGENKKILATSLANIEKINRETVAMKDQGFMEATDADQIELTRNNIQNSLSALTRQNELAYKFLKLQMGMDINQPLELSEKIVDMALVVDTSLVSMGFNLFQNPTFQLLETQEKLANLSLKREYSKFLPSVGASFNHQWRYDKPDFDFMSPNTLGVQVSLPIFTSGSRLATVSKQKLELQKARNTKDMAGRGLEIEALKAQADFRTSFDKFKSEMKNLDLAERIYNKTSIKFREGMCSSMELTQAQNQYLNTQSEYFKAISDLLVARTKIVNLFNLN